MLDQSFASLVVAFASVSHCFPTNLTSSQLMLISSHWPYHFYLNSVSHTNSHSGLTLMTDASMIPTGIHLVVKDLAGQQY